VHALPSGARRERGGALAAREPSRETPPLIKAYWRLGSRDGVVGRKFGATDYFVLLPRLIRPRTGIRPARGPNGIFKRAKMIYRWRDASAAMHP
jgi:hypothetical protein